MDSRLTRAIIRRRLKQGAIRPLPCHRPHQRDLLRVRHPLDRTAQRLGDLSAGRIFTDVAALDSVYASGGFKEDADGEYRLDLPDAMLLAGVDYVSLHVLCTGAYTFEERIPLETQGAAEVYNFLSLFASSFQEAINSG